MYIKYMQAYGLDTKRLEIATCIGFVNNSHVCLAGILEYILNTCIGLFTGEFIIRHSSVVAIANICTVRLSCTHVYRRLGKFHC